MKRIKRHYIDFTGNRNFIEISDEAFEYFKDVQYNRSKTEQMFACVYFDLATEKVSIEIAEQALLYTKHVYMVSTHQSTKEYLESVLQRATPARVKQAKKSLDSYMKYLIHDDFKHGVINHQQATSNMASLPDFLTTIKLDIDKTNIG